jgi:membrane protein
VEQLVAMRAHQERMTMARKMWGVLKSTAQEWSDDNASRLAASLAYYTLLSVAPLIVLAIAVVGLVFGDEAARGQIADQLGSIVGPQAAQAIQAIVKNAQTPQSGVLSSIIGVAVLLAGASGVFGELQNALDTIWEVEPKPGRGIRGFVHDRFFSFTMVLGVAFLLLVSTLLSAALAMIGKFFSERLPGGKALWHVVNFGISLAIITVLFGLIFKVVPDVKVAWRQIWLGAFITALLFTIGKQLLGLYLGKSSMASSYGAAGSLVVLVVWVYYSAQILFLGAEFSQVYARSSGMRIRPSDNAKPVQQAVHQ